MYIYTITNNHSKKNNIYIDDHTWSFQKIYIYTYRWSHLIIPKKKKYVNKYVLIKYYNQEGCCLEYDDETCHTYEYVMSHIAKETYKRDDILQKRPII